jgi:hypothetical protein
MSGNNQPNLAGWAAILTAIAAIITAIGFPSFFPNLITQIFGLDNSNIENIEQKDNLSENTNPESPDKFEQDQKSTNSTNEKASDNITVVDNIKYEFVNCQQSSQRIRCTISVTNQDGDKSLSIFAYKARIIANGEQYAGKLISFGSQSSFSSYTQTQLVKDISINLYINFDEISNSLSKIDLLEFSPSSSQSIQIKNIQLSR